MTSPLSPSMRAGASGRSLPAARTNSGTDRFGISTSGYGLARATVLLLSAGVAPVSHLACRAPQGGCPPIPFSARPEHRLRAAEQRDRLPGVRVRHDRVPDLRRPPGVHVRRRAGDPPLARRPQVVALQLDGREAARALG